MEGDWRVRKSSLEESLGHTSIFYTGFYSDVAFLVGEEEFRINAHKTILSARSEPLATMFHERWTSAKEQEIKMPQNNPTAVKHFLKFLYTDAISFENVGTEDILETSHLAQMYQVHKLLEQCISHLTANISEKNCLQIHKSCQLLNKSLSDKALQFFFANVVAIAKSNDAYLTWDCDIMEKILKNDKEHVSESILYKALLKWRNVDSGRNEAFSKLTRLIRFPTMSPKDFASDVVTSGVLSKDEMLEVFSYIATQTGPVQFPTKRRKLLDESDPKHFKICGTPVAVAVYANEILDIVEFDGSFHKFSLKFHDLGQSSETTDIKLYGVKFFSSDDLMEFIESKRLRIKVTAEEDRRRFAVSETKVIEKSITELNELQMRVYFDSPLVLFRNVTYSIATDLIGEIGPYYSPNENARFELPQLLSPCYQQGLKLYGAKLSMECFVGSYSLIEKLLFSSPGASADSDCKIS